MKKKILICGTSKNLGKFLTEKFGKKNYVFQLSSSLKSNKKNIFKTDITNEVSLNSSLTKIKKKINNLDVIIFTVGKSRATNGSLGEFKKSFDINFFSFVNLVNKYLKVFGEKKVKIIAISSIAGVAAIDAPIEYSTSKSALNFYVKKISKELIKKKISINVISPGNILINGNNWSKRLKKNKLQVMKYINKNVPSKKFINPDEIFNICELIISEKIVNLVGANIIIDGGQTIQVKKKILITGANGFLGSYYVDFLYKNNFIVAVDKEFSNIKKLKNKNNLILLRCDLSKENSLKKLVKTLNKKKN